MTAHKMKVAGNLRFAERDSITAIKLGDLFDREIFEDKPRADIEGRLVHVGDEQVGFSRVSHCQRQPRPRSSRVERTSVVPGSK